METETDPQAEIVRMREALERMEKRDRARQSRNRALLFGLGIFLLGLMIAGGAFSISNGGSETPSQSPSPAAITVPSDSVPGVPTEASAKYTDKQGYSCTAGQTDNDGDCPGNPDYFNGNR